MTTEDKSNKINLWYTKKGGNADLLQILFHLKYINKNQKDKLHHLRINGSPCYSFPNFTNNNDILCIKLIYNILRKNNQI